MHKSLSEFLTVMIGVNPTSTPQFLQCIFAIGDMAPYNCYWFKVYHILERGGPTPWDVIPHWCLGEAPGSHPGVLSG